MKQRNIRIIGVPLDLGAGHRGVDMGPSAIRVTGLIDQLETLGHRVIDSGDVVTPVGESIVETDHPEMRYFHAVYDTNGAVARAVEDALAAGEFPLVVGGDHSLAIGSLAGAAKYASGASQCLGVIWLDAHADMNTPESSPSGNIHGMSLAISLGRGHEDFVSLGGFSPKLAAQDVVLVGIRDLDQGERAALLELGVKVYTMRDVDEIGMFSVMTQALDHLKSRVDGIYVQFDMDVIDPQTAPGTGTPVCGGLSYREAHLAMEMLASGVEHLVGLDLVETNPALDVRNQTGRLATELILSLMGKTILRTPRARR